MSQAEPGIPTAYGYAPPSVQQFAVFLDNRIGKLYELLEVFEHHPETHICALSVHEATDHAVVRIIANNSRAARHLLRASNLTFTETSLLIVELTNDHTLTSLCLYLLGAEISIRFAYPLMFRPNGTPSIAISVDDQVLAGQILRNKRFRLLGECDLPGPNASQGFF